MADANRTDDVEKILSDQKLLEDRKQSLINDLLQQREAAIKAFDEKLAKLGWHDQNGSGKPRKSHHKQTFKPTADAAAKPKPSADTSKK
jgi:hypothetical protein